MHVYIMHTSCMHGGVCSNFKHQRKALVNNFQHWLPIPNCIIVMHQQSFVHYFFGDVAEIILNFPSIQCNEGWSECGLFSIATLYIGFDPADLQCVQSHLLDYIQII